MTWVLVVSCEHAGNRVPAAYRHCFTDAGVLDTHRAVDHGALALARAVGRVLGVRVIANRVTRLLVDVNRSLHHRHVFSEYSRSLPPRARARLVATVHRRHRRRVEAAVAAGVAQGAVVLHVSVHSFTPVLNGAVRRADVGLLYDPRRPMERSVAGRWLGELERVAPAWRLRRNYPYRGAADGLTTALRGRWLGDRYLGIELEANSALLAVGRSATGRIASSVARLAETLHGDGSAPEPGVTSS